METLIQDIKYGLRMLGKKPGFAAMAIVALALGIGANSAIFSVVNGVLLRPLPYTDPDRLVWVWDTQPQLATAPTSLPDFLDWRDQNQSFEHMAAFVQGLMFLDRNDQVEEVRVGIVTPDMFPLLRVAPVLGRAFTEEETVVGKHRVAVLGYSLWQRRFGSDAGVVGQTVSLSGFPYTIIGVMPAGFNYPDQSDLWRPFAIDKSTLDRGPHFLRVVARLKPSVTLEQAQAEMSAIAGNLAEQFPEKITGHGVKLQPLRDVIIGDIGPALYVLLGAVGFVLMIACANVANLLLARSAARQKEFAIRAALGASRARIIKQLLTESTMLSLAGGSLGLLVAFWGVRLLISLSPGNIPRTEEIGLDRAVVGFTLMVSVLTGMVFGLAPALQVSKPHLNESLKESGRSTAGIRRSRLRSLLVVAEIALALVLLVGAGLTIKSLAKLGEVKPGFQSEKLLTMGVTLLSSKYKEDEQAAAVFQRLLLGLGSVPGVESFSAISEVPMAGSNTNDVFVIEGRPAPPKEQQPLTEYRVVAPRYFQAMGIPLLAGRDIDERDTKQTPNVVVVNETFVRRFFPDESPLGHRIKLQGQFRDPLMIIGVVGDVRHFGLNIEPTAEAYVPYMQDPLSPGYPRSMTLVIRTAADPRSLTAALRGAVQEVDKSLPVYAIKTMDDYLYESLSRQRFNTLLLAIFAAVALALAAVGIYGVLSYVVTQRTHEIGIRMALGARGSDVLRLVVGQGMTLALIGVAIGLGASLALTRLAESLLYGVSATDPATFTAVSLLMTGVALAACFVPARRATKVDPMVALRYE